MVLPDKIKDKIAKKLVKDLVPVLCILCIISILSTLIFLQDQYFRIFSDLAPLPFLIVSWLLVKKGRVRLGGLFLIISFVSFTITAMVVGGGIEANGFMGALSFLIVVSSLYGTRGSIIFAVAMLILGTISIQLISFGLLPGFVKIPSYILLFYFGLWFTVSIFFISVPIKLMAQALEESQKALAEKEANEKQLQRFAAVIGKVQDEVVITDINGIIQYVNSAFEINTGFTANEVLDMKPSILKSGLHDSEFYRELWTTILDKKVWRGVIQNRCKNREIILHDTTITPILDSKNQVSSFVSIRRDITEKTKNEKQEQQAHKMEAIGTLAGGIAHDFNNILSGILGYSELVQGELKNMDSSPSLLKKMDRIVKASFRASDLVRQILDFSRSGRNEPVPINVKLIVKEAMQLLRASLPSSISIEQFIDSDRYIMADPTNVHQIFMNLCTNARDAMVEKGGILSIKLEDITLDAKAVSRYKGVLPGRFLFISVEDTGHGMETKKMERIFEPFYTTKSTGKGTGMGLSVVHGIITAMNGFIDVSSIPGQGTTFKIFLPAYEKLSDHDHENIKDIKTYAGNEKILFIDDEPTLAEMAQASLECYGYDVTIFSSSIDALEHFKKYPDKYDLIISDITMPEMTGDILVKQIHLIRPDIPVVVCTGFSELIDEKKKEELGVDALLTKPVPAEEMALTIRTIIDGKNDGKYFNN